MILRPQLSSPCEYVGHTCLDCDDHDDMFTNITSTLVLSLVLNILTMHKYA